MRRLVLLFFTLISFSIFSRSQSEQPVVNVQAEQIFIHFDKSLYLPGETVFFKSYILHEGLLSDRSSSLYVDIANSSGKITTQKIFPVYAGTVSGSIDISPLESEDHFFVRAYTDFNKKTDTAPSFIKKIAIAHQGVRHAVSLNVETNVELRLFPEGGSLTEGVRNTVAFETLQDNGQPAMVNGIVQNNRGDIIAQLTQMHAGMGTFQFIPEKGMSYHVSWKTNSGGGKLALPIATRDNVNLHLEQLQGRLYYILSSRSSAERFDQLFITVDVHGKEVLRSVVDFKNKFLTNGIFGISKLPPGIVSIKLWDQNKILIAERIVFVNHQHVMSRVNISFTGSLSKRSKHTIEIEMPDSSFANMSLSVFDDNFSDASSAATNIAGHFLLNEELRGRIHQPSYYFSDTMPILKDHLDLVMLTHGWRSIHSVAIHETDNDNYITVEGIIKPLKKKGKMPQQVVLMIRDKNGGEETTNMFPLPVTPDGRFRATGLVFSDSAMIYCSIGKNAAQAEDYQVILKGGLEAGNLLGFSSFQDDSHITSNDKKDDSGKTMHDYFLSAEKNKKPNTLEMVTVKARKPNRLAELEERYTSAFFRGGANNVEVDVASDSLAWRYLDIYNFLLMRLPQCSILYKPTGKRIIFPRYGTPLVYLNESLIEHEQLASIDMNDVAYVKFIRQYYGARNSSGGISPAIAVYLKKDADLYNSPSKYVSFTKEKLRGYTAVKEFYSPDYAYITPDINYVDARTTLFWQPYILTDASNRKLQLSFYNNDLSKKLRVVLQGIDENGRFIYEERTIQ